MALAEPSQCGPSGFLRCITCGAHPGALANDALCPSCGDLLEWIWDDGFWHARTPAQWQALWRARRTSNEPLDRSGVWRFREMLPLLSEGAQAITLQEGNTPLYALPRCGEAIGLSSLYAKHQGANPTGSFKDTGMTAAVSAACAAGAGWLACASTGNTSASMAAYAARAGLGCLVLVPEGKIAWGKLAQALDYGALTCQLRTDFDGCVRVLKEVIARFPAATVNSINPNRIEGQKTVAAEIAAAFDWQVPDHIIVPGGNLANASSLGKGFLEMHRWGLIGRVPRISIIQAQGANPLVRCWRNGGEPMVPVVAETLASAIRIGNPASWKKAARVLHETGGECLDVTEAEIVEAKAMLGREGVACEPASATTLAGAAKLARLGCIRSGESVVLILTGHGLKDPDFTLALHRGQLPFPIDPPLRRAPLVLEPQADAVLRLLDAEVN